MDPHWHKGRCGLRPEGEDSEEEQERLRELEENQVRGPWAGSGEHHRNCQPRCRLPRAGDALA